MIVRTGYLTADGRARHRERVRQIRAHSPVDEHGPRLRGYRLARADGYTAREAHEIMCHTWDPHEDECGCLVWQILHTDEDEDEDERTGAYA